MRKRRHGIGHELLARGPAAPQRGRSPQRLAGSVHLILNMNNSAVQKPGKLSAHRLGALASSAIKAR
jgi:hypothetical protein